MRETTWRAFVPKDRPAETQAEWTREMDWVIAKATDDCSLAHIGKVPSHWGIGVSSYSTDLAAVVRAAEKWGRANDLRVEIEMAIDDPKWYACIKQYCGSPTWEIVRDASTPALALARALYAAITAEGEKAKPANVARTLADEMDAWAAQYDAFRGHCPQCGQFPCKCKFNAILDEERARFAAGDCKGRTGLCK